MKNTFTSFCYIPDIDKDSRFLNHLQTFQRKYPLFVFTDGENTNSASGLTILKIPKIGPFNNVEFNCFNKPSDRYATWAFINALKLADEADIEWFLWLETDCRFSESFWDSIILHTTFNGVEAPLIGGTPVCWHPWSKGAEWSKRLIEFAYKYQRSSGLPMAFEGAHDGSWGTCLYPNGALALYKTSELLPFFEMGLKFLRKQVTLDPEIYAIQILAFDLYIGRCLTNRYGLELIDRFAVSPRSYSGCDNHHINEDERIGMLSGKRKVAVHQIKRSIYDF